ncbi:MULTISPECIES: aminopeptidase P family protein [unclassified Clostridium]|mgnify:FL=1|uniref:aminopeptidase P family protein n=1 Tax=unclassified Clostridium TaxID=2614128 RepID=UPI001C8C5D84|nr:MULTISPECIES: aminopeptidase P family protein [unclassified Clostridium]MBX9137351.1 aminopeptidase P family protein [Clostridium sp. K12(2020)]MBX9144162.1 aminopeptidase P family protein [Clostridium sp. K13]
MNNNIYKINRNNLLDKIKDNSIVVLFAGKAVQKTGDQTYPFTPNRNFYYLTGINEEDHILVMSKINGVTTSKLYIKDIDLEMEKWVGKSIRKEEATEVTAVDEVKFKSQFESDIHSILTMAEEINIYLDLERMSANREGTISHRFANDIMNKYPQVRINNVYSKIGELRLKKSQDEVEKIKKAIEITKSGIEKLMVEARVGMKEYELEAYFDFNCKVKGATGLAFTTIAAAGKNATTLHYVDNNSELKENDLILFDLGAEYNCYNADITRTFPVNGKFTERQREVYNSVLKVNEEIINLIKPGMKYKDVNEKATDLIAEECIKLGLIEDKKDVRKYYYHSIGHSLGMDTHDIETPHRDIIFEPGVIFTVEPGIYIEEEGIGIRIEDDILVTEEGVINLSKDIIKSIDDIEEFMNKYSKK